MDLEQQIREVEGKFPEMRGRLGDSFGSYGQSCWERDVREVEYGETDDYQMALARWEERDLDRDGNRTYNY